MEYIKVHTFDSFEQANNAIDTINKGEGIPINDSATTRTYTEPQENDGNIYILSDEVTQKYLGEPTEIDLVYDDII